MFDVTEVVTGCPLLVFSCSVGCRAKNEDRAVLSRTLACIADIIGVKANNKGGLRSGPAANLAWQEGLELLKVCYKLSLVYLMT